MDKFLTEEIGRNYHTLTNDPYSWKDSTDLNIETYLNDAGEWLAKVSCISRPELSTPYRTFPDEGSATYWAEQQSDRITRKTLNEISILKDLIKELLIEIL